MSSPASEPEEFSLVDAAVFLKKEGRKLLLVFLLGLAGVVLLIATRPLLYEAKTDLLVGSAAAFTNAPVEPFDQLKYLIESRYNDEVSPFKTKPVLINIVRNTNILNMTVVHEKREDAVKLLEEITRSLIADHAARIEQKKSEARKLLAGSTNLHERDITNYVEILSSSHQTRLVSPIKVKELPFSGMLLKGLVIGFFGSMVFSLLSVLAWKFYKDFVEALHSKT